MGLEGRVALVTGGSRGIGRAIADRLASLGADVVAGDIDPVPAQDVLSVRTDISRSADVRALFATTLDRFGKIDIVITNAGIEFVDVPFADYADDQIERVIDVNVKGTFLTLREAARAIDDGGRIVVVSSNTTRIALPGFALYGASKLAGQYFVDVLAKELGRRGVTVNAVVPGATLGAGVFTDSHTDDSEVHLLVERTPLRRLATPPDIAGAVAFLVGDEATFITGHHLVVDGGASA